MPNVKVPRGAGPLYTDPIWQNSGEQLKRLLETRIVHQMAELEKAAGPELRKIGGSSADLGSAEARIEALAGGFYRDSNVTLLWGTVRRLAERHWGLRGCQQP